MAVVAGVGAVSAPIYFGWRLLQNLIKLNGFNNPAGGGFFISPISVYFALILALNGAGPLSPTQKELWLALSGSPLNATTLPGLTAAEAAFNQAAAALQAGLLAQSKPNASTLVIANAVWSKNTPVLKPYADAMLKYYNAPVRSVPSAAPINTWASEVTNGLIKQVVPANLDFSVALTNAVYFKGLWEYAFDKASTTKAPFTVPQGPVNSRMAPKEVQVDMMTKTFKASDARGRAASVGLVSYAAPAGQGFRAVKLPYKGSALAAVALLPDPKKYPTVEAAAADISPGRLFNSSLWQPLYAIGGSLDVSLPKFSVEVSQLSMGRALQAMGITAAFDENKANFSRISQQALLISDVLQSAVVKVDEQGTEAAAVTSVIMTTTAFMPSDTPPLVFDRPFLFLILDDASKSVLFHGYVKDPTVGQPPTAPSAAAQKPQGQQPQQKPSGGRAANTA